jgi:hypothetical protein
MALGMARGGAAKEEHRAAYARAHLADCGPLLGLEGLEEIHRRILEQPERRVKMVALEHARI